MATQDQDGDLQRQINELKAATEAANARAANNRRREEAANARVESYRRETEAFLAEAENHRREREATQARAENMRRETELLQQKFGPTTLYDYLRNCHNHLYKNLRLGPKRYWSTSITDITGKFYPKVLLPWTDFETDIVPRHFGAIDKIFGDVQAFHSKSVAVDYGSSIADTQVSTERDIRFFESQSMETPVWNIIRFAARREEFQTKYDTTGVWFTQSRQEVSQLDGAASDDKESEADPEQHAVLEATPKPDTIGMRLRNNDDECLAFVYDYTAAHKVDVKYVREAVAKPHLFDEVVQRINSAQATTDDTVRDREEAEASIATSIVQVYDYMVSYGVAYGYVAAGFTLLLLYVDRNDPQTLFCHPCMPLDLADPIDGSIDVTRTQVAQMLCFCLQSFQSDVQPGSGRSLDAAFVRTVTSVKTWPVPYVDVPRAGLESPASTTDPSQSTDDSDKTSPNDASDDAPTRQYCTQACLLGLQRGHDLDENCPNATLHRDGRPDVSRHLLDAGQFADLMGQQLRRDPYHKCALVNYWTKGGAMGWMFKLELLPYGYTLVGKGTVAGRRSRLEHEGRIYERLSSLQGHLVPVHLGLVNMGRGYIILGFRFVVHMMLMSWAGEEPDYEADKTLMDKKSVSANTVFRAGVYHGDDRLANHVWNAERGCVMIIDFDHAKLLPMPKPKAVDALLRSKRKGVKVDGARKTKRRTKSKSQPLGLPRRPLISSTCDDGL